MPVLTVPAPLRQRLGDEATDSLVALINAANNDVRNNAIEIVGEKFERRLSEEIGRLEVRLNERIMQVETRLDKRISDGIAGLRVEMANTRTELVRWMFAFWVGQIAVVAALLMLLR